MDPERPGPRPGALSDLEAKLLAAKVGGRLFQRPAEPVQLGRYRLLGRLGQGGMSVVFRAQDPQLRREVAVKLLHSPRGQPDPEQLARLRREAQALGRLSHPNVVQVFEIGEADGQSFVVMEFVRGTTLREWLRARPRALAEVVAMVSQAGRGLAAAHAAGIIHRDLKPENVLVGEDGRARVVDFGLARANPGAADTSTGSLDAPLTKSGTVLGTPAFMAPEQLRDPGRADARSDQFSFCVMAYEALLGERPFEDLAAVAAGRLRPPPPGTPVPTRLREALLRGLRTDPAERWPTMDALLAALTAADGEAKAGPRRRRWLIGAGALALVVAAVLAGRAWSADREARAIEAQATALEQRLARLLAAGEVAAADALLADVSEAQAGRAWASWARLLEQAPGRSTGAAWAHAYVFAGSHAQARRAALLGLARAAVASRDAGRSRASGPGRVRADAHPGASEPTPTRADAPPDASEPATTRADAHPGAQEPAPRRADALPGASGPALARAHAPPGGNEPTPTRLPAATRLAGALSGSDPTPPRADSRIDPAGVLALITAEAPELLSTPELAPLHAATRAAGAPALPAGPRPDLEELARQLGDAAAPPEVIALARAGLLDLAAATLLTLAGRAEAPTRARWQLAAATLVAAAGDGPRALALATAAAQEPTVRAAALGQQVALLSRDGHIEAAAAALAARLAETSLDDAARRETEALRDRLAAMLGARSRLPLRFGETDAWIDVDPAALRGDPVDHALDVAGDTGLLAAWSLELRADRLLVEVDLTASSLTPGAAFAVAVTGAEAEAQVGLRVVTGEDEAPELALTCGAAPRTDDASAAPSTDASAPPRRGAATPTDAGAAPPTDAGAPPRRGTAAPTDASAAPFGVHDTRLGPAPADPSSVPRTLQLDLDLAAGTATCRVRDAQRATHDIVALPGAWRAGPASLELRGSAAPAVPMQVRLRGVELLGATLGVHKPASPLPRAAALLVDGDPLAAIDLLADVAASRARLWQALAAIRLHRGRDVAALLERALADEPALELELQRWLRSDPDGLAPALRHALGEARYLQLFARAWSHETGASRLSPAIVRRLLAELGGLDERCAGAGACAELHRAHGRALAQIGEATRARRAFEAALAVAPADASGRALASQLVLDLALVKAP
ncbi:protein kinase [Nannocystis sp. RBIL2]|uniref:serine/threonine-protein kinase n=1 Tax=Nannocystis sp. RBIL2 TaxID=2996788 RepID=UPI00226D57F0|nr:serine/threonine-protein kinase [Nannocystis sp. RBIL2]MCY1070638.1 protein kinase [Nannocystis sp. RBIL2]